MLDHDSYIQADADSYNFNKMSMQKMVHPTDGLETTTVERPQPCWPGLDSAAGRAIVPV